MSEKINVNKENAIRILEYWFLTELLNQESLDTFKEKGKKAVGYKEKLTTENRKKPNKVVEDFVQFSVGDNLQTVLDSLGMLKCDQDSIMEMRLYILLRRILKPA